MKLRSLSTIAVYWFALVAGLALFTVTRTDVEDVRGLWVGVLGGTALGQFLAVRDLRLWIVAVILLAFLALCGPLTPMRGGGTLFWMAMVPATLCGWLSLGDRGSLFAFWLPVVLWMLTILDRGKGALTLASGNAALLGGLAFLFFAFLHARETRRVDLWRHVAPTPIAPASAPVILREVPRLAIGVAGWSIAISGAAFAICAWLAPRLWHVESLVPELHATAATRAEGNTPKPCCHDLYMIREQRKARVEEYFDLGRAHDDGRAHELDMLAGECVVCGPDNRPLDAGRSCEGGACPPLVAGNGIGGDEGVGGGIGGREGVGGGGIDPGEGTYGSLGRAPTTSTHPYLPPAPADTPQAATMPELAPLPSMSTDTPVPPSTTPPPAAPPPPGLPAEPEMATAPVPRGAPMPPDVASGHATSAPVARAADAPSSELPILAWIAVALGAGLAFQLLALGLRPIRRVLTLRHLRAPFWHETVDQRISNYWHLVLVGLRDAGWRTASGEAPRELAKRLDVDGVERAAVILERARHGVGIDATDLGEMSEVAERAYRESRARASAFARFLAWFRRPLV